MQTPKIDSNHRVLKCSRISGTSAQIFRWSRMLTQRPRRQKTARKLSFRNAQDSGVTANKLISHACCNESTQWHTTQHKNNRKPTITASVVASGVRSQPFVCLDLSPAHFGLYCVWEEQLLNLRACNRNRRCRWRHWRQNNEPAATTLGCSLLLKLLTNCTGNCCVRDKSQGVGGL